MNPTTQHIKKDQVSPETYDGQHRFEVSAPEQWMPFLEDKGYCIIRRVATEEEVTQAKTLLWEDMKRLFGVEKCDITTWEDIPNGKAGILSKELPQTGGPWSIRGLESIRSVFSILWNTEDLLVSMDSLLIWLPWWVNEQWAPISEGLHVDQNPFFKPQKCCVQGMVPLIGVTEEVGGLEVIPFSHRDEAVERFKRSHPQYSRRPSDFCIQRVAGVTDPPAVLLRAEAGDLILWDSRLIHGGRVGTREAHVGSAACGADDLPRISIPICMTPRSFASTQVQEKRKRGFECGRTYTHWAHEAVCTNFSVSGSFAPVELSTRTKELV